MGLFVVNRHEEATEDGKVNEKAHLDRVLKQVERNKKIRQKQKEKLKLKKQTLGKIKEQRQLKRKAKAKIVVVPENDDTFIDESIKVPNDEANPEEAESKKAKIEVTKGTNAIEGFTILGGEDFKKKTKVKRVLPKWLTNATVISVDLQNLQTKASKMKVLNKSLRTKLKASGIKYLFPVQAEVIPWLLKCNKIRDCLQPNDICVSAPTGSGKTLAFVLPIVQALEDYISKHIRALVILPTQGLALQVFKSFKKFAVGTNIKVCLITGKSPFEQEQKQLLFKDDAFGYMSKVDILVCTAGRLVDHLKMTPGFTLEHLKFLVIDEADRVLDNVQNDWLYHLERHIHKDGIVSNSNRVLNLKHLSLPRPPQKLLFSATLSQDPEKLQKLGLFQPKLFTSIVEGAQLESKDEFTDRFIGKYTTPKELTEKYIVCSMDLRPLVLYNFVKSEALTKTMVFTYSLDSVHRLTVLLKSLFKGEKKIEEIGSKLDPKLRNKLIEEFEKGEIDILVCTDALARGIDLTGVKCVISYSAPKHLKTYIHRAGRSARAGELGLAVTLVDKSQVPKFQSLLQQASKTNLEEISINEEQLEPLVEQYKGALASLKETIEKEEADDIKKMKSSKRLSRKKRKRID